MIYGKYREKKPLPTIGVDKYTFFAVKTDTSEGATYGDPYNLRGTVEIAPTDAGGSDVFDADNGAYETSNYIEKLGHDITNADIPPEVDSMWRGLTQKDGVVEVGNDTKTVYFGVAWENYEIRRLIPLCKILQGFVQLCVKRRR